MSHAYIALSLLCTVYAHLVLKWQVNRFGDVGETVREKFSFVLSMLINPWMISSFVFVFLASAFWMLAMTKHELSYAYPILSLSFVLLPVGAWFCFGENLSMYQLVGSVLIILGIVIATRLG